MVASPRLGTLRAFLLVIVASLITNWATAQDSNTLLRLQRSKAFLNLDTKCSARPGNEWHYLWKIRERVQLS
jgi:hypothetical protein